MFSEEHLYSIALRRCSNIGDMNFHKLIQKLGSTEKIWKTPKSKLVKIEGIGSKIVSEIGNTDHLEFAEKELLYCSKNNITILLRHKSELPKLLKECDDAPAILYKKGDFDEARNRLSIIGTRNITHYGRDFIKNFLHEVAPNNILTISGLALGVDAEVHVQSLENNIPTIGVLAHGFHTFYPSQNKFLADRILENGGCLLTEFNTSQKPDRENFIQRNRIIAGLSEVTIVVETAFGGGSISTVTFANNYNRDVYALPGKITDKYSQGCNNLIAQNKAATIASISQLITNLNFVDEKATIGELFPSSETRLSLTKEQQTVLNIISENTSIGIDLLSEKMEVPSYKILPIILELELLGYIRTFSGQQFSKI